MMTLSSTGFPQVGGDSSFGSNSTPFSVRLHPVDPYALRAMMKFGGRTDDVWSYHDVPGYRSEVQGARFGGNNAYRTGSGSVKIRPMGSGGTSSNPGGYNWNTFGNVVQGTAQGLAELYNFGAEKRETSSGQLDYADPSKRFPGPRFGNTPIYNTYRGKQQKIGQQKRVQALSDARKAKQDMAQKQADLVSMADEMFGTSQNLAAGVTASRTKLKPGASSRVSSGAGPAPVNLLTGPTALGIPPKKPRAARSTVQKPKATRPSPNTFDPSIW
jgi:hypothetical protein